MDLGAEVDCALEEMEWGEVVTTLTAAVHELLNGTTNPPSPPPPPPPSVSAGLEANTQPQPAESQDGGYGDWIPVGADHHMFEEQHPLMAAPTIFDGPLHPEDIMQPGHLHCGAGACCQGQYLPYLWPVEEVPTVAGVSHPAAAAAAPPQTAAAFSYPAPPPQTFTNVPVVELAEGQSLRCVGLLNGDLLYEVIADVAPPVYAAPPQNTSNSKKRKRDSQQDDDRPYIKRPPNAFMLFLKEQRANVEAEVAVRGSAAMNTALGQKWKSLTKEQQAKYYHQAENERLLHSQQHPEWSTTDNYGKKRKRQRSKASRLDSLRTVPTSLTSPLAERTLEERCHPTTVRLCRPTAQPQLPSSPHVETAQPQLPSPPHMERRPTAQPQLPSPPHLQTAQPQLPSPPHMERRPPAQPQLPSPPHMERRPPAQPQLPSSPHIDTFTADLNQMLENCFFCT